jgi:hypothetical protein
VLPPPLRANLSRLDPPRDLLRHHVAVVEQHGDDALVSAAFAANAAGPGTVVLDHLECSPLASKSEARRRAPRCCRLARLTAQEVLRTPSEDQADEIRHGR